MTEELGVHRISCCRIEWAGDDDYVCMGQESGEVCRGTGAVDVVGCFFGAADDTNLGTEGLYPFRYFLANWPKTDDQPLSF